MRAVDGPGKVSYPAPNVEPTQDRGGGGGGGRDADLRCAVVGGGIIGLSIAWRLVQRGVRVQVFDAVPLPAAEPSARAEHPGAWFVAA
ncbi:FAD-dependent oxidoreductase, partial [Actinoplanes sp. NPDC051633]|uniref:FAD-dependent oxidoreductase n=1 Tax=Actinoplanes sp. NPDC051633 TaxID=3155670 RepID=UPI00342BEBEE